MIHDIANLLHAFAEKEVVALEAAGNQTRPDHRRDV